MERKDFEEILEKYLRNRCTSDEEQLIERWFESINIEPGKELTNEEFSDLFKEYQKNIQTHLYNNETRSERVDLNHIGLKIAATILIIVIPLTFFMIPKISPESNQAKEATSQDVGYITNTEQSALPISLSDGSKIILNPGSSVTFKKQFEKGIREISLEGEAFFKVTPDSLSPFIVKTGNFTTKVLGTSFTVKANKNDEDITVTVKTGKVAVQTMAEREAIILEPNQRVVYDLSSGSLIKRNLQEKVFFSDPSEKSQDREWRLRFNEASVSEIFKAIEKTYETEIIFESDNFSRCFLSTSISKDESLFDRLDIVCKAIGATYKMDGTAVVIEGKACSRD